MILAQLPTGDWTQAAAIMTFAIPVGLFVIVATVLYFLYTKPHTVPGHRDLVPATGSGRSAVGAPRPPSAQPPGGGYPQGGGGAPGAGGYGRHHGMEGR